MHFLWLLIFISCLKASYCIQIRTKYSPYAPPNVPDGLFQEVLNMIYIDAKAINTLIEPQYIIRMEEIQYRNFLKEEQIVSVYNFRNLNFFSMVNNSQKNIPNFRNLPRLRKIQIKECNITLIEKSSVSNIPVEVIDFQKNQISHIEKGAFGKKVHSVDLKCNLLTSISPDWFKNASNLEWLNLESNEIENLQENLFKKFSSLVELYLAKNKIVNLEPGSLSGPLQMHVLDLGTNDISIINADVFSSRHLHIDNIRISFNRISFITEDLMDKLTINNNSVIYGNPWQCPCVKQLRDWLPATNVNYTVPGEASCVFTPDIAQTCIQDVSLNNELYNHYISNFEVVDTRTCSTDAKNFDEKKRKALLYFKWGFGDIDIR